MNLIALILLALAAILFFGFVLFVGLIVVLAWATRGGSAFDEASPGDERQRSSHGIDGRGIAAWQNSTPSSGASPSLR